VAAGNTLAGDVGVRVQGVNSAAIVKAVDDGACSVQSISAACGAATDCTHCTRTILRMLIDLGVRQPAEPPGPVSP
jgi:bacterioferritin-associated ferredoxin